MEIAGVLVENGQSNLGDTAIVILVLKTVKIIRKKLKFKF